MKPLKERKEDFYNAIWECAGKNYNKYSESMLREIFNHFSEHNVPVRANTLMLWEKQKKSNKGIWNLNKRMAQWKARNEANGWGPKDPTKKDIVLPPYLNKTLWQKLDPEKTREYKIKLQGLGWIYSESPSGNHWLSPTKERIWL